MAIPEYRWRDRILLLLVWVPLVFYVAGIWADGGPQLSLWLLFGLILAPIALTGLSRLRPLDSARQTSIKILHSQPALSVLLSAFALAQLLRLDSDYQESMPFDIVSLELAMLVLMWLFWHRGRTGISQISVVGTWMLALVTARTTLMTLEGRVDFTEGSPLSRAYIGFHIVVLLLLVLLPLLLPIPSAGKLLSRALGTVARQPIWISVLILGMAFSAYAAHLITGEGLFRLELIARLGALAAALALGALLLRLDLSSTPCAWPENWPMGRRGYALGLLLTLLLYSLLAPLIGALHLNKIDVDGLAYLTIARRYASGEMAIRGYWSPLISWAMAPLIALGTSPQLALRLLNGAIGIGWIFVAARLGAQAGLNLLYRLAFAAGAGLTALRYGFVPTTPDVLGAFLLSLYFVCLTPVSYSNRPLLFAAAAGITGALAYYGKYYNLPFILAHLVLTGCLLCLHGRPRKAIAAATVTGLATLCLCAGPWVGALASRYGTFTISTSGAINHAVVGPSAFGVHPCAGWVPRLCDHPADVLFPFEDPQPEYYPDYGWSPFSSLRNFRYQIRLVRDNLQYWLEVTALGWGPLFPLAALVLGTVVLVFWAEPARRFPSSWLFLTVLLYPSGYLLTWSFDTRYFIPLVPLALLAFYALSQAAIARLAAQYLCGQRAATVGLVLISTAAPLLPLLDVPQMRWLLTTQSDKCRQEGASLISDAIVPPFAGTTILVSDIAYFTNKRTLGVLDLQLDPVTADAQLREYKARTLIAQADSELTQRLVSRGYHVVDTGAICGTTYAVLRVPSP